MKVMVIVKATKNSEAGVMPSEKLLTEMGKYNEELVKAGIMLGGEGLHPSAKGKRIKMSGGKRTVVDGPFNQTNELIAGYWLWQVRSMEEAIDFMLRAICSRIARTSGVISTSIYSSGFGTAAAARAASFWYIDSRPTFFGAGGPAGGVTIVSGRFRRAMSATARNTVGLSAYPDSMRRVLSAG